MQAYVNKFTIALSQDKTEAVINFTQMSPDLETKPTKTEPLTSSQEAAIAYPNAPEEMVARLVMTGQCAQSLATTLQSLLSAELPNI